MNRIIVLVAAVVFMKLAWASPNPAVSEKQSLYGVSATSYFVLSVEWEIKISYLRAYQRTYLKEYSITDNREINSHLLSSTINDRDIDTQEIRTVKDTQITTTVAEVTESSSITLVGYQQSNSTYLIDREGVFVESNSNKQYLLSAEQIASRIPDYDLSFEYEFDLPAVVGSHVEYVLDEDHHFVIIRKGRWRGDTPGYELVFSIPGN